LPANRQGKRFSNILTNRSAATGLVCRPASKKVMTMNDTLILLASGLLIAAAALASPATAQQSSRNCGDRDRVVAHLAEGYGETRQSVALAANNTMVEVFASLDTGTWTITMTSASGRTCLLAAGQSYQPLDEVLEEGSGA